MVIDDSAAGATEAKPRRSCNRHIDCDAYDKEAQAKFDLALARAKAQFPNHHWKWPVQPNRYSVHCHDDDCEDCLGK